MATFGEFTAPYLTMAAQSQRLPIERARAQSDIDTQAAQRPGIEAQSQIAQAAVPYAGQMAESKLIGTPFERQGQDIQRGQLGLQTMAQQRAGQQLDEEKRANLAKEAISAYTADPLGMHPEIHPSGKPGGLPAGAAAPEVAKGAQGAVGEDFLRTLPIAMQQQVKAIADGKMAPPSGFALKNPYWQQMLTAVSQYDPTFDLTNWGAREKTLKEFTSGSSFKNLNAINTAIGHLGTLSVAASNLNNTSIPFVNTVTNFLANQLGDPRIKTFDMAKNAVSDELMRVFRQVGASQSEAEAWRKTLDSAGSPEQFKGSIKTAAELLESRIDALNQGFKQGFGKPADTLAMTYPKSRQVLDMLKAGGEPPAKATGGAPSPGTVMQGFRFKGGDPASQANWEPAQ